MTSDSRLQTPDSLAQIEKLIQKIEMLPDAEARANAVALVQALMEFHGAGLERMMDIIAETKEGGFAVFDSFAQDELIGSLLLLYGLHPLPIETRVIQALDKVRPYLDSHGGNVELLGIADGVARLRLQGSCKSCPSSSLTLKLAIEDAIYAAAPDVVSIEAEGVAEPPPVSKSGFVQIGKSPANSNGNGRGVLSEPPVSAGGLNVLSEPSASAGGRNGHGGGNGNGHAKHVWQEVPDLASLKQSSLRMMELGGRSILFCRLGENYYAYGNDCPGCGQPLEGAQLELTNLICPNCRQQFDVIRAGRGLDQPNLHLEPIPLLFEQGRARVRISDAEFRIADLQSR